MPCVLVALALLMPRLVMIFIAILTNWFSLAYQTTIWPVIGWFLAPYTTLAYMAAMLNNDHTLSGWWTVLVVFAILADLGVLGGSASNKSE